MSEEKEEILKVRNSRKLYIPIYLMILILFLAVGFIKISGKEINDLAFKMAIGFSAILILITELHRLSNSYEINSDALVSSSGILNKKIRKADLVSISDVGLNQTLWQRMLGYGNISARMFSQESATNIKNVGNPSNFVDFLGKKMRERR